MWEFFFFFLSNRALWPTVGKNWMQLPPRNKRSSFDYIDCHWKTMQNSQHSKVICQLTVNHDYIYWNWKHLYWISCWKEHFHSDITDNKLTNWFVSSCSTCHWYHCGTLHMKSKVLTNLVFPKFRSMSTSKAIHQWALKVTIRMQRDHASRTILAF